MEKEYTKEEVIGFIKNIIADFGEFTCSDVEADSSPVIRSLGANTCQLAERFTEHKVEAIIYDGENEVSSDFILYEDLSVDVLGEIWVLASKWFELNNQ